MSEGDCAMIESGDAVLFNGKDFGFHLGGERWLTTPARQRLVRIPDPVPALEARIAELEGALVAAKELPVLAVRQCESQVQREVMDLGWKMVEIHRRIDAALKPPTPAAAKET